MNIFREFYNLQELIDHLNELALSGRYVFRGFGNANEIYPSIIRLNLVNAEDDMLYSFERYGASYLSASTPLDFLAYAQHYGLSTRLLDFSHNPFIALFFSLYGKKTMRQKANEDKLFYNLAYTKISDHVFLKCLYPMMPRSAIHSDSRAALCMDAINTVESIYRNRTNTELSGNFLAHSQSGDISSDAKKIASGKLLFVEPSQSNQRIIMQQGLFLFPHALDVHQYDRAIENNITTIRIHKDIRHEILAYLSILGFDTFRLMPDLASICSSIVKSEIEREQLNAR